MTRKFRLITSVKTTVGSASYLMKSFLKGETRGEETDLCIFFRALTMDNSRPATRLNASMLKMKIKEFIQRRKEHDIET